MVENDHKRITDLIFVIAGVCLVQLCVDGGGVQVTAQISCYPSPS